MSVIRVRGLRPLKGEIGIQGSKNAVLPMMAAAILHKGTTVLTNVPRIQDVFCMMGILEYMGCVCQLTGHRLTIDAASVQAVSFPEADVRSMRSSVMVLAPVLSRLQEISLHYPGGCSIGSRPIDLHLHSLKMLGAEILEEGGMVYARAGRLKGGVIRLPFPSVGATETAVLGAVLAKGNTVIYGAAREPEIQSLCLMLNQMGAGIEGVGSGCLTIRGAEKLSGVTYQVPGDRIVAGTYLAAAAAAGGRIQLSGVDFHHLEKVLKLFEQTGGKIGTEAGRISMTMEGRPQPVKVHTDPYPGFPTDLQSPLMAVLSVAEGVSRIREDIFEARYETAGELRKLGADIIIEERTAVISGKKMLTGAFVSATDLRGGAALVVAGLAAGEETRIDRCGHIFRGYEDICRDLSLLGADITYQP